MISGVLLVAWCAFMNRARGSQFNTFIPSTTISRILAMGGIAVAAYLDLLFSGFSVLTSLKASLILWALLYLWTVPRWDAYWSACIGNDHWHSRLWGLDAMTGRMLLILPALVAFAYAIGNPDRAIFAAGALLLGLPYYVYGHFVPKSHVIQVSELTVGALIGSMLLLIIGWCYA